MDNKQDQKRLKLIKLSNAFLQINGYKPQPLDLNSVVLSPKLEELVEKLAQNTHNVWAKERIKNGWTYGVIEVFIFLYFNIFLGIVKFHSNIQYKN